MNAQGAAKYGVRLMVVLALLCAARTAAAQGQDDFFDDSTVHELRLTLNSKDWSALKQNFKENIYYPTALQWRGVNVSNVGIRSRGLGSRSGTKPGLRVDMDRYNANQTFVGLKSFVLDNLVQDPSMLRERLAMAFFRRLGLPAPREAHARLFVNGTYVGLYAIVETIDKGFLGRSFGEDGHGGTENDGYLFEYDYTREYRFENLGSNYDDYKIFEPKTHENDAASKIWGPIVDMVKAINDTPDAIFERELSTYLDLTKFVNHIAIESFLAEDDGILGYAGLNNFYFYRFEDSKRSQFLAWDKDNTFHSLDADITKGVNENVLARRTLAQPQYRNRFFQQLIDAANAAMEPDGEGQGNSNKGPGWLEREVARMSAQIRSAGQADNLKPFSNNEFNSSMNDLLIFARERADLVKQQVGGRR
jgi:spore coat protein CotH